MLKDDDEFSFALQIVVWQENVEEHRRAPGPWFTGLSHLPLAYWGTSPNQTLKGGTGGGRHPAERIGT